MIVDKNISSNWGYARITGNLYVAFQRKKFLSKSEIIRINHEESERNVEEVLKQLVKERYLNRIEFNGEEFFSVIRGDDDPPSKSGRVTHGSGHKKNHERRDVYLERINKKRITSKDKIVSFIRENKGTTLREISENIGVGYFEVARLVKILTIEKKIYCPEQDAPRRQTRHYYIVRKGALYEY